MPRSLRDPVIPSVCQSASIMMIRLAKAMQYPCDYLSLHLDWPCQRHHAVSIVIASVSLHLDSPFHDHPVSLSSPQSLRERALPCMSYHGLQRTSIAVHELPWPTENEHYRALVTVAFRERALQCISCHGLQRTSITVHWLPWPSENEHYRALVTVAFRERALQCISYHGLQRTNITVH